ncbi:MAG: hypothetical protein CMO16_03000 [Thaumarchaeota archaeon]|nr:hypothetical protein [Nitrososphaerota archaeon]|tara:strand:+ start:1702 stop:2889 length:1188 start_codon:yes stop_codon:yes gene_type:complete
MTTFENHVAGKPVEVTEQTPAEWAAEHTSSIGDYLETITHLGNALLPLAVKDRCSADLRMGTALEARAFMSELHTYFSNVEEVRTETVISEGDESHPLTVYINGVYVLANALLQLSGQMATVQDWLAAQCNVIHWRLDTMNYQQTLASDQLKDELGSLPHQSGMNKSVAEEYDGTKNAEDKLTTACTHVEFYTNLLEGLKKCHKDITGAEWAPKARTPKSTPDDRVAYIATSNRILAGYEHTHAAASETKRLIVYGDAQSTDMALVKETMDRIKEKYPTLTIYTGTQDKGVESMVRGWCTANKVQFFTAQPDFKRKAIVDPETGEQRIDPTTGKKLSTWDKSAPFNRNRQQLIDAIPHAIIIIGGGSGIVQHWKQIAEQNQVKLWEVTKRQFPIK